MKAYDDLIGKIDAFIRKYYTNKVIRGSIYFSSVLLFSYLLLNTLEYFLFLSPFIKKSILSVTVLILLYFFIAYILIPFFKIVKLGRRIDHVKAAEIIGKHFKEIEDKLLNTLELNEQLRNEANNALLIASIEQRTNALRKVPFVNAVNYKSNNKYLKYVIIPFSIIIVLLFAAPRFIQDAGMRMINYNVQFEKPAPFSFILLTKNLTINQSESLQIDLGIEGDVYPQDIYIHMGENTYKMEKKSVDNFLYTLNNIQESSDFYFSASGFNSKLYTIEVIAKPSILNYDLKIQYPSYTGRSAEVLKNIGDVTVPLGSTVQWNLRTENSDEVQFVFDNKTQNIKVQDKLAVFSKRLMKSSNYSISPVHPKNLKVDTLKYRLDVIPDQYPSISFTEERDSIQSKAFYFNGSINDDYGFTKLTFNYIKYSDNKSYVQSIPIVIDKKLNAQRFFFQWNLADISLSDRVEYYFEIVDNDAIQGPKSTRSKTSTYQAPTEKELNAELEMNAEKLKQMLNSSIRKSEQIQKDAKKLNEKLIEQKSIRYEEKKQIQELIRDQKLLEQDIKSIQEQLNKNNELEKNFKESNPDLLEKQKKLEELFETVLDEKTKSMIKELEKLLEQSSKELTQEQLKKMEQDNKSLEKEMDRMLEMYKKLEFDKKRTENIEKLEKLSEEQKALSEESKKNNSSKEEMQKKQEELNAKTEELKKELDKLEKENEELEEPENFENPEKELSDIKEDMKKSSEELSKKNTKKASDSQKSAADKMKALAEKMKAEQMMGNANELDLNIKALRQILDNLITSSFTQEKVMEQLKRTSSSDPQYVRLTQSQKNIKDDMKKVEDSLYALSKKVVQIKSFVNKEVSQINNNIDKSVEALAERRTPEASMRQQYAMTSMNNLALLLTEILQQMQNEAESQKKNGKPGSKPGKKPGSKSAGQSLSKMQDQLNKQLEEMKSGKQPGQGKDGKDGKNGQGKMSEQLAKMAAQQQAIRNALSGLEKEMNKNGQGGNSNEINQLKKEMEKTESDIYNKKITQETLNRQQEIMTRLLETEKAAKERELDEQRTSKQGVDQNDNNKSKFEEYKKEKLKELELIKTVPPNFNPYYKEKVNEYFKQIP